MSIETSDVIDQIAADSENIEKIFNNFYIVPDYQRAFVWTEDHVNQLLDDLKEAFVDENNNIINSSEYFIGSIVVSQIQNTTNKDYEIIDGQQRLTTFFILFCAIRDFFIENKIDLPDNLPYLIRINRPNPKKVGTISTFRIKLQYDDSMEFLEKIAEVSSNNKKIDELNSYNQKTLSIKNLATAYATIRKFLTKEFDNDLDKIWSFWTTVIDKVKLIKINTPSVDNALNVFETINQRGESLQAIDLLKNLVFRSADHDSYDKIKKLWAEMLQNLILAKEKPMRFLRYFIINRFNDAVSEHKPPREDDLYQWLKMQKKDILIQSDPINFAKELKKASETWINYANHKTNNEKKDNSLENISLMSNGKTKQHFILLLSAQHLPDDQFLKITQYVENLLFFYMITGVQPKYWERKFIQLSKEIKALKTSEQVDKFISNNIKNIINEKIKMYEQYFMELTEDKLYKYQLKYILSRIAEYLDDKISGHSLSMKEYYENTANIEHILPRTKGQWVFDDNKNYDLHRSKLGNLTLLETKFNSAASNNTKDKKIELYNQSKFIITSIISKEPYVGQDGNKLKIAKYFSKSKLNNWDSITINNRQEALMILSKKIWNFE